jgi:hypothetical protein
MSISAVSGVAQILSQLAGPGGVTAAPAATSFDQEVDAQSVKTGLAHGHHHHHAGESQSATSSASTAASAAGVAPPSTIATSLLGLLG